MSKSRSLFKPHCKQLLLHEVFLDFPTRCAHPSEWQHSLLPPPRLTLSWLCSAGIGKFLGSPTPPFSKSTQQRVFLDLVQVAEENVRALWADGKELSCQQFLQGQERQSALTLAQSPWSQPQPVEVLSVCPGSKLAGQASQPCPGVDSASKC